jgi:NTE family protein
MEMSEKSRPKTALVFAGGGSFGALQVGMLKALLPAGLEIDMVVGASVGAINAAYFAGNPTAEGVATLESLWRGARRQDVFPLSASSLLRFAVRRDALVDPGALRHLVSSNVEVRQIEHSKVPLYIVATDLLTGEAHVIDRGDVVEAILASTAIPVAFPSVFRDGRHLVDAAVSSNTPVKVAVGLGARRIIVLPTGFSCALQDPPRHAIARALHSLTLLIASQLVRELEVLGPEVDYCIVPPLCPLGGSPYDFSRSGYMIDAAAESTASWISSGGLEHRRIPGQLRSHAH